MIGFELSASAKLTDIWIINTNATAYIVELIFDLIWLVLVFYSKFFLFRIIFLHCMVFDLVSEYMNRIYEPITCGVSSFQKGLDWVLFKIGAPEVKSPNAKFGGHKDCGIGHKTVLVCHMVSQDNLIKMLILIKT